MDAQNVQIGSGLYHQVQKVRKGSGHALNQWVRTPINSLLINCDTNF